MRGRAVVLAVALWAALAVRASAPAAAQDAAASPDNQGGVLYLSLAPELVYTENETYKGLSATPPPAQSIIEGEVSDKPQIAFILAAFPPETSPELTVASFGIRYPPTIKIVRYGLTRKVLQMATGDWPLSGEGMMFGVIEKPDTSHVMELGWLAIVASDTGRVELVPHPEPQMGARMVTSMPRDAAVAGLGRLGFGTEGYAPEPVWPGPKLGAACVVDSLCMMLSEVEAKYYAQWGAVFLGLDVVCGAEAYCLPGAPEGACCLPDGSCRILSRRDCARAGGAYRRNGQPCEPDPCGTAAAPGGAEGGN